MNRVQLPPLGNCHWTKTRRFGITEKQVAFISFRGVIDWTNAMKEGFGDSLWPDFGHPPKPSYHMMHQKMTSTSCYLRHPFKISLSTYTFPTPTRCSPSFTRVGFCESGVSGSEGATLLRPKPVAVLLRRSLNHHKLLLNYSFSPCLPLLLVTLTDRIQGRRINYGKTLRADILSKQRTF